MFLGAIGKPAISIIEVPELGKSWCTYINVIANVLKFMLIVQVIQQMHCCYKKRYVIRPLVNWFYQVWTLEQINPLPTRS